MAKYVLVYHGRLEKPKSEAEGAKMMSDWKKWIDGMGAILIDAGNGVGMSKTVMSDGAVVDNGGSNPISGYCLVRADSMEEVLSKIKDHPILAMNGSIEIAPAFEHS